MIFIPVDKCMICLRKVVIIKISTFFSHRTFHEAKHCRDISLNAKYLVILKNVRDRSQFSRMARQVCPNNSIDMYGSCLNALQNRTGIVLDLSQDIDDLLRFRN